MSDGTFEEFPVSSDAPKLTRVRPPGRTRRNRFDKAVVGTFNEAFYRVTEENPEGRWLIVECEPDEVAKIKGQIRNAATYNKIGSNVRANKAGTAIWFRGAPKSKGDVVDASNGDVDNGSDEYDDDGFEQGTS